MLSINRPTSLNGALKVSVTLTVAPQSRGPSYASLAGRAYRVGLPNLHAVQGDRAIGSSLR
jgi:hypothetical protein